MPSHGFKKDDPLDERLKVQFSAAHTALIRQAADMVGMTVSAYIRGIVLAHLEEIPDAPKPSKARHHAAMLELAQLHELAMQIKKLGTNVNQLAKQANQGMVPIERREIAYMLNQHQLVMSSAVAAIEKSLG